MPRAAWRVWLDEGQANNRSAASSTMTKTVPDIMLQKLAPMVASMTNSIRRRSMRRPRRVLRMMMNGAAKARNGTATNVTGRGPVPSKLNDGGRWVRS
jgi:hypothetical protein